MNKALLLYEGSRIARHTALRRVSRSHQAQAVPIGGIAIATRKTRVCAAECPGKSRFKVVPQIAWQGVFLGWIEIGCFSVASHVA
ncbi:hypothetical protein [Burkholderia sp. PU8-34]